MKAELLEYLQSADLAQVNIASAAAALGVTERNARYRLRREDLCYQDCLDAVRRELVSTHPGRSAAEWRDVFGFHSTAGFYKWYEVNFGHTFGQREAAA